MEKKSTYKFISTFFFFTLLIFSKIFAQQNLELINNYLNDELEKNGWLADDIKDWVISDQYLDKTTGVTHAYIQQRHNHIIVFNAISNFVIKEDKVLYFKSGIIDHLESKVNTDKPTINSEAAIGFALRHLGKSESSKAKLISDDISSNSYVFDLPGISSSSVKVQLVYRQTEKGFILAWDVSMEMKNEPHWWNIRVNALTGEFIDKNDFTVECNFDDSATELSGDNSDEDIAMSPATVSDYRVFAYPLEAPSFGSRSLLSDPADPTASPYGWQDVNGIAGEDYTITRGNNVYTYEDANADNLPGYSPDGGVNLDFDFPFTLNAAPLTNQDASLTNLFYDNNAVHDYLYSFGFTEAAGNFQQNNYGRGGVGNDYVKAEGFDGGGSNNADFNTPPDGSSGRMQMYLWSANNASCSTLNITSTAFTGPMTITVASFSPAASVSANLILVNDGVAPTTDACTSITNTITGKVALIDRGICSFYSKAQVAIAAGAVGVIIINNVAGCPPVLSGSPALSVPVIAVSLADGNILKAALLSGNVVAAINTCNTANPIDGSFDNGVIAHEYGHGVSNRLTGGPSQSSCLNNAEQGGEGWSDWLGLMMTMKPGDLGSTARGVGTFVRGQPTDCGGIRRFPYSTDMSINPQTYADVASNTEVHAIGEIWCDAIWDMSWFLINDFGFSTNPSNTTAGNNIAIRLVLEGMKLQPCNPGFLDARDAILTADALLYNNAHRCRIWEAFARRGMGFNASQGSAFSASDQTAGFNMPPYCSAPTQIPVAAFTSDVTTVSCGGAVRFTDQSVQAFDWLWNFGDQTSSILQNPVHTFTSPGTYNVNLLVTNPLGSSNVTHTITVTPNFSVNVTATPISVCTGDPVQLNAVASGATNRSYTVASISYAPEAGAGTSVTLADDALTPSAQPIGFTFNFYGQNYTGFYICSNGFITFSPSMPAQPAYGAVIPGIPNPNNLIALAWNDLYPPSAGSTISYFTTGTSPNQKLVVKYNTFHYAIHDPPFTSYPFIVQAILYEGTNIIEIHSTTISDASAYDPDATTTQGVENKDGSQAVVVPGRNGVVFSASNDAYRFTPFIPYSYTWSPGNMSGPAQTVNPVTSGVYTVQVSDGTSCLASFTTPSITVNPGTTYYADADADTYGVTSNTQQLCAPSGIYTATVGNDCNDNNANIHPGVTEVLNGVDDNCNGSTDEGLQEKADIKLFVQGFYKGGGQMQPVLLNNNLSINPADCDYITLELHASSSPYSLVSTQSSLMKTDGTCEFLFSPSVFNQTYYLVIRHRNSLETWSSSPVFFNTAIKSYDFSISAAQAFGNNQADLGDGRYAIISGDVNQNGNINLVDFLSVESSTQFFNTGYVTNDLTGDGLIESSDYSLVEDNIGRILSRP